MIRGDQVVLLLVLLYAPGFIIYFIVLQFRNDSPQNPIPASFQIFRSDSDASDSETGTSDAPSEEDNHSFLRALAIYDLQRENPVFGMGDRMPCQMDSCFKYSHCPVFTNPNFELSTVGTPSKADFLYRTLVSHAALKTKPGGRGCFTFLPVSNCENNFTQLIKALPGLRRHAKGSNFVMWVNCPRNATDWEFPTFALKGTTDFENTIVVSPHGTRTRFEEGYDIISPFIQEYKSEIISTAALKRSIMVNFDETWKIHSGNLKVVKNDLKKHYGNTSYMFPCKSEKLETTPVQSCGKPDKETLEKSVFTVICLPNNPNILSTSEVQEKFFNIIRFGSIPVIIGSRFVPPFHELIDWSQIIIRIPADRILQIPKILYSLTDSVREAMRIQARLAFNKYFTRLDRVVTGVIETIALRLSVPGIQYVAGQAEVTEKLSDFNLEVPESMNFTVSSLGQSRPKWYVPEPRWQPTSNLWDQSFNNIITEFRPNVSLPNALHREMFTVVILTYNRVKELMLILNYLKTLPRVHKIIIAWNSKIPSNFTWPENITVPIHAIQMEKNSLNNRFFPFEAIETDAVLNIDDDIYVSHEALLFGFRIWQENRDRLVGYPARGVWNSKDGRNWFYDTNQCTTSLILTGCAFVHKLYHVKYTFQMPEAIRKLVDKKMNCEDIAMNFLVSHLSQKPPIKVTAQKTFDCYGCGAANNSLWRSGGHFSERTACVAEFRKIYGYTALFNTHYYVLDLFQNRKGCLAMRM